MLWGYLACWGAFVTYFGHARWPWGGSGGSAISAPHWTAGGRGVYETSRQRRVSAAGL